jgi:hypothetical protein
MGLVHRSQPLMRLPVDQIAAKVMLLGGKSFDGSLFIAIGEDIITIFTKADAFIPVACEKGILLVARDAIAGIVVRGQLVLTDELPTEQQLARVHLRDGHRVDGELRWTAPEGRRRTADFLNDAAPYIVVHGREGMTYIAKRHVAWIEEQ